VKEIAHRVVKLINIAGENQVDPMDVFREICLENEPAYILCPSEKSVFATYALQRKKSSKFWLTKQERSHMREIEFFSDDTISSSSIKIPPRTYLEIPQGDLKLLAVLESIEVSRFSRTIPIDIDNHLHITIVSRTPYSYFEAPKTAPPYPKQNQTKTLLMMEHHLVTTVCSTDARTLCIEAPVTISIKDIWVHADSITAALKSRSIKLRKTYPWRTPALQTLIEAAETFFKGKSQLDQLTKNDRTKIDVFLQKGLTGFTKQQVEICRLLITPEHFHREGDLNIKKWQLNRNNIEDHISISLHYMIQSAKKLDKQALQSSTKHIKKMLQDIGPTDRKPFSDKKLNCAMKAIKAQQRVQYKDPDSTHEIEYSDKKL